MLEDEFQVLIDMHNDRWPDTILSVEFNSVLVNVLTRQERIIVELKVQNYEEGVAEDVANKEIAKLLKIKPCALLKHLYNIKYKYRNKIGPRIDNTLRPYSIYKNIIRKGKGVKHGRYFRKNV